MLYRESPRPARVVILLSDADGWDRPAVEEARALASLDALVVGVDVPRYLATMAARGGDELYPFADLEVLSQFVQKKVALPAYVAPIVVGYGTGATMAYAAAVQARPETLRRRGEPRVLSSDARAPQPLGGERGLVWTTRGTVATPTRSSPPRRPRHRGPRSRVVPSTAAIRSVVRRFVGAVPGRELVELPTREAARCSIPKPGCRDAPHARTRGARRRRRPADRRPAPSATCRCRGAGATARRPARSPSILSGDGGWASLDREVGEALAAAGVGVVGVNSLSYFWTKRTPDGAAADLARVLRHYRARLAHAPRVLLIGYSRGADVLPFLASRLPERPPCRVDLVALLGPGRTTDFEFHLTDWLGGDRSRRAADPPRGREARDLRVAVRPGRGRGRQSLSRARRDRVARRLVLPGGHHFGGDYGVIATRILAEAAHPSASPDPPSAVAGRAVP